MEKEIRTKEELKNYLDGKIDRFKKGEYAYLFELEDRPKYEAVRQIISQISEHILSKTHSKRAYDEGEGHSGERHLEMKYQITDNQEARFYFSLGEIGERFLRVGMDLNLKSPEDSKTKIGDQLNFLEPLILKNIPTFETKNEVYIGYSSDKSNIFRSYTRIAKSIQDDGKIKDEIYNQPEKLAQELINYFDEMYTIFKPIANSLERNYGQLDKILKDNQKEELRHQAKTKELSDKLFE